MWVRIFEGVCVCVCGVIVCNCFNHEKLVHCMWIAMVFKARYV